ncbi:hypothetical protein SAMD00019534_060510 [Acytostelium subglobosum LB1]|uniref:hypothetical protein n=1 Tax=Acytostelium subglobosum LB1 TaxID=1410327 RepID=UPI000644D30A|nr:hypothetical protein SAMD00019534_060510 [Acytostelium subglobosum LB1]GAM22876.1 hypothetical protein SAMD00019534_060510 [Acytostelium subglobosum LB1]|eukprot:XP_012754103.1 hypothetical protein SAMD00019534_060510 [Acytostelium subglobosum LB1]
MQSFETISATTTEFKEKYHEIVANQEYYYTSDRARTQQKIDPEISRVHWFLMGIIKYSDDLKKLSFIVYDISIHPVESNHMVLAVRSIYHSLQRTIKQMFNNIKRSLNSAYPFPRRISKIKYPFTQRAKVVVMAALTRIFAEWIFALKFSIGATLLSFIFLELRKHTTFILFNNFEWVVITYQFVMSSTVGTSTLVAAQRLGGTLIGGLISYGVAVLVNLPSSGVASAFILQSITFILFTQLSYHITHNEFPQLFSFIGNTFLVLSISMFYRGSPSYVLCLLRVLHISIGNMAVVLVSNLVLPQYDQNKLDSGLCQLMDESNQLFKQLIHYHFRFDSHAMCPNTCNKELNNLKLKEMRAKIATMRSLINNVHLELMFKPKIFRQYRDLLKLSTKLYVCLVSLDSTCQLLPSVIIGKFNKSDGPQNLRMLFGELDWTADYLGQLADEKTLRFHSGDSALYYDSLIRHNMYQDNLITDENNEFDQDSITMSSAMLAASSYAKTLEVCRHILWSIKGVQEIKRQSVNINSGSANR